MVLFRCIKYNFTEGRTSSSEWPPPSVPAWSFFSNEAPLANHNSRRAARTKEAAWKRCWTSAQGVNATDLRPRAFNLSAPDLELAESFDSARACVRASGAPAGLRACMRLLPLASGQAAAPSVACLASDRHCDIMEKPKSPPLPPPPLLNPAAGMRPWSSYQHIEGNFLVNRERGWG